jgi:hypothetical protein
MHSPKPPQNTPAIIPIALFFLVGIGLFTIGAQEKSLSALIAGISLVVFGCYFAGKLIRARSIDENNSRK